MAIRNLSQRVNGQLLSSQPKPGSGMGLSQLTGPTVDKFREVKCVGGAQLFLYSSPQILDQQGAEFSVVGVPWSMLNDTTQVLDSEAWVLGKDSGGAFHLLFLP